MFIQYEVWVIKDYKQKVTPSRLKILSVLSHATQVLTAYEILNHLHDNWCDRIDITTIYRNLELFESLGLIHKIYSLWGYMICMHIGADIDRAHDMIVCHDCHHIQEVDIDQHTKQLYGFKSWPVQIVGRCKQCQNL